MYSKDAGSKPQLSGSATSPLGDAHCLMTVRSISASLAGETQALGVRKICCVVQVNKDGSHPSPGAPTTAPSKSSGSRSTDRKIDVQEKRGAISVDTGGRRN